MFFTKISFLTLIAGLEKKAYSSGIRNVHLHENVLDSERLVMTAIYPTLVLEAVGISITRGSNLFTIRCPGSKCLLMKDAATVIWQSTAVFQSSNAETDYWGAVNWRSEFSTCLF